MCPGIISSMLRKDDWESAVRGGRQEARWWFATSDSTAELSLACATLLVQTLDAGKSRGKPGCARTWPRPEAGGSGRC